MLNDLNKIFPILHLASKYPVGGVSNLYTSLIKLTHTKY